MRTAATTALALLLHGALDAQVTTSVVSRGTWVQSPVQRREIPSGTPITLPTALLERGTGLLGTGHAEARFTEPTPGRTVAGLALASWDWTGLPGGNLASGRCAFDWRIRGLGQRVAVVRVFGAPPTVPAVPPWVGSVTFPGRTPIELRRDGQVERVVVDVGTSPDVRVELASGGYDTATNARVELTLEPLPPARIGAGCGSSSLTVSRTVGATRETVAARIRTGQTMAALYFGTRYDQTLLGPPSCFAWIRPVAVVPVPITGGIGDWSLTLSPPMSFAGRTLVQGLTWSSATFETTDGYRIDW